MHQCHDNILMKPSAVRVKTGAERNVSTSRTGMISKIVYELQDQKSIASDYYINIQHIYEIMNIEYM